MPNETQVPAVPLTRLEQYWAGILDKIEGGGGNPNYVETITGTLANPWGVYTVEDVADSVLSGNMTVYIVAEASALGLGSHHIYPQMGGIDDDAFPFGSTASNDGQNWRSISVLYERQSSELARAYALINGSTVDLMQYALSISTNLTIIHHPLPDTTP